MALASNVTLEIEAAAVPFLAGAREYAAAGAQPGGLKNNRDFAGSCVAMSADVPAEVEALLYDPQTSGGLLVSLPAEKAAELVEKVKARGGMFACIVGEVVSRRDAALILQA